MAASSENEIYLLPLNCYDSSSTPNIQFVWCVYPIVYAFSGLFDSARGREYVMPIGANTYFICATLHTSRTMRGNRQFPPIRCVLLYENQYRRYSVRIHGKSNIITCNRAFHKKMLNNEYIFITYFILPQNISILVVLLYAWRISVNMKKSSDLEDVYYGE